MGRIPLHRHTLVPWLVEEVVRLLAYRMIVCWAWEVDSVEGVERRAVHL